MTLRFPVEITREIFYHLPLLDALYFHDRLPENDPLQPFLYRRLYRRTIYATNETELRSLVKGNLTRMRHNEGILNDPYFIKVAVDHPNYFSRIPRFVFNGSIKLFSKFASLCGVHNLESLILPELKLPHQLPQFSTKLRNLTIGVYDNGMLKHIPNLRYLELHHCVFYGESNQQVLPVTLRELKCVQTDAEHLWRNPPLALKKLTLRNDDVYFTTFNFPEVLVALTIDYFDFRKFTRNSIKFPSKLQKMLLKFGSLGSPSVEIRGPNWDTPRWGQLKHIPFPRHLKELTLEVWNGKESIVASVRFPETLEYLVIKNIECPSFPQGLKVLKIMTQKEITIFPPKLLHLEYYFRHFAFDWECWDQDVSEINFQFPSTLRTLVLASNYYYMFNLNLNLPELVHMELVNFWDPIFPKGLSRFSHICPVARFDGIVPYGVKKLKVVEGNLMEYPDSILDLEVKDFDPLTAPPFPKNLRYLTLYGKKGGLLSVKDLKLPRSLYNLSGTFDKRELEALHLKAGNRFLNLP